MGHPARQPFRRLARNPGGVLTTRRPKGTFMLRSRFAARRGHGALFAIIVGALAIQLLLPGSAQAAPGRIKEFLVPTQDSHPGGVAMGADGGV